ncbi:uncharacterized protein LOC132977396 [Labrus mixtus]|uniref:uncharacterized protein LOC132977396 n=1 Tax=Labrus mixtus TaxID=508554 RepID=UPI0029C03884|nr:uncharacterized protein LOC132977396 [Labrus mixtus]
MKKGPLHFLGRKSQSLFDTNVKMKDMENVDWVLESSAIPESGTASVRARPTVKHHSSSYDSLQGFAVPTPKVPLLPPVNGPKINGSVGGGQLSNGSVWSVPDLSEDDIFVPPRPSMAPPPPPGTLIPPSGTFIPPPDFMGDLSTLHLATPEPPSMPAPDPPSLVPSMQGQDLTFLKPPPMAPPKPPSTCSSGSASSVPISNPPSSQVPVHPSFSPPQPPAERQRKAHKTPPPKPIRLSSISNNDSPPQTPAPPPPVQTPTLSTFNPQHTAKLYNVPTTSIVKGYEEPDTRPKQKLLLQDSSPVKTDSVLAEVNGKTPKVATPSKPVAKDAQELDHLQLSQSSRSPLPEPNKEAKPAKVSPPPIDKPARNFNQTSPSLQKVSSTSMNPESSKDKLDASPSQSRKYSPIIDRKLRNLKGSETNGAKVGPAASPLALLMAAKKREKHKTTLSLSRENSAKKDEQPSADIQTRATSPNSLIITPRSSSSSSLASQERFQESPNPNSHLDHTQTTRTSEESSSSVLAKNKMSSSSLGISQKPSLANHVVQKQNTEQSHSKSNSPKHEDYKEELSFLPPPPEFDDLDDNVGPPPSVPPPDPPRKMAPTLKSLPVAQAPAPPPPPKPPQAPKLPPPDNDFKPRLPVQTKPKVAPNHIPSNLSPSQVTLLSILQKKMAEMDHKMAPLNETESSSDDWGSPLSDEDNKVPVVLKSPPQSKNNSVVKTTAALDMRELEGKVAKKYQDAASVKSPTSNGVQSNHQYGKTFTVRPGTKNPISLFGQGQS